MRANLCLVTSLPSWAMQARLLLTIPMRPLERATCSAVRCSPVR